MRLTEHLASLSRDHLQGDGRLVATLIGTMAQVALRIERELAAAAIKGRLGATGAKNETGDSVQRLDLWGHEVMVEALGKSGACAALLSEEAAEPVSFAGSGLVVCADPIDGSSNLAVGGNVGTIFAFRPGDGRTPAATAALGRGTAQLAAGYVLYGPTTTLVYAAGRGVHGFTLDRERGEFMLTAPDIAIPSRGKIYGINEGNVASWHPGQRAFVEHLKTRAKGDGRPYSLRYSGAMVADVHRILLEGGIFMYPVDVSDPARPASKLRLLYEVAPMALVVEQAGGRASTGTGRALEVVAREYHQRAPILIGSRDDVDLAEDFYRKHADGATDR